LAQVIGGRGPANNGSMRVEDRIFLDRLRALGFPWIDRLIDPCTSRADVQRILILIRVCGPDYEEANDLLEMSTQMPQLEPEVQKILAMIRLCEDYRS
jgi:hypothetical protein